LSKHTSGSKAWFIINAIIYTAFAEMIIYIIYINLYSATAQQYVSPDDYMQIKLSSSLSQKLIEQYNAYQEEYSACIIGHTEISGVDMDEKYNNFTVYLDDISDIEKGKENYSPGKSCKFAMIHKHPNSCTDYIWSGDVASAVDSFQKGATVYIVHCPDNKLNVFTREDMYHAKVIAIA
jgi:hypothetical protein